MTRSAARTALATGVVALATVALAACASQDAGSTGLGPMPSASPSASASSPAPLTTGTATATATASATASAGGPCDTNLVKVTAGDGQGAAGTLVQRFIITNTGKVSCTMNGRPFISPYGPVKQGTTTVDANLNVAVKPIPADFGDLGGPATLITLQPGDTAAFFFRWSQVPVGNAKCTVADGFDFRPPNDPSTDDNQLVAFDYSPCGDVLYVSNVLPPTTS